MVMLGTNLNILDGRSMGNIVTNVYLKSNYDPFRNDKALGIF